MDKQEAIAYVRKLLESSFPDRKFNDAQARGYGATAAEFVHIALHANDFAEDQSGITPGQLLFFASIAKIHTDRSADIIQALAAIRGGK